MNLLDLAELHIDALYQRDAAGSITASRDPEVMPPRFHLLRTPDGNRWLLAAGVESMQRRRLAAILSAQPPISDCADAIANPPDLDAIRAALVENGRPAHEHHGPAFFFPDELPAHESAELLADLRDAPREGSFAWLRNAQEASQPIAVVRAANREVASVCYSARSTSAAAEAGVETADKHRRRGYGSWAVLEWAAAVRKGGRVPLYSTEWDNTASRALARRLGLICYAEDLHMCC